VIVIQMETSSARWRSPAAIASLGLFADHGFPIFTPHLPAAFTGLTEAPLPTSLALGHALA
jgi:hypothetical protein